MVEDFKVNRIQKRTSIKVKKYVPIPITERLRNLLIELGYDRNQNTDNFILAPEVINNRRKVMSDTLSRSFSHYYDQLNTGKHLTFKCLRKTYITNLQIYMGGNNTKSITGHSDNQVIERNYIDKKEVAKAARGFNVFPDEIERKDELTDLRKDTQTKNQNPNLDR
jgi:hypothetical protein